MTVGFDAKRAFNNRTGLGNYSRFVIKALQQHSAIETLLYTPKISPNLFVNIEPKQVRTTTWPRFLGAAWRTFGITDTLKTDKVQVYHGLSNEIPYRLKHAKIKSVVTIHDLIFERFPELYPSIDRFFYRQKFKRACQESDCIVAVSEQTKRDIIDFYHIDSQRIKVVYQDCDEVFQKPVLSTQKEIVQQKYNLNKPFVLCVGTLEARKNQERLIDAFYSAFKGQNIDLVLVGKGPAYQQKLAKLTHLYEMQDQVKFLNNVPFADLPSIYQLSRVFAYVSRFEGFGIPIVEALHSQVPVLAATGSCLEEAGGGGALYANPDDEFEIAQKLKILWHNETLRTELITNAQKHLPKFADSTVAQQLTDIYQNL
jgi:glycosyltransferase involved in cell wall biosynthesis